MRLSETRFVSVLFSRFTNAELRRLWTAPSLERLRWLGLAQHP